MGKITVAPATESEAPACLALLPEAQGLRAELLVARLDGELAGAAAMVWQNWSAPGGFPFTAQVLPHARRRGVGRELVAAAADLAAPETDGLWSAVPVELDSDAAAFLRACGFQPRRHQHHFQARIDALLENLAPLTTRMRARGRAPAQPNIVDLAEAPLEEVGWLVSAELGGGPIAALRRLQRREAAQATGADRSQALLHADQVAAVMLWRIEDQVAVVDARVVAPSWRGDWPNLLLLEAALHRAKAEGLEEFRFHCDEDVRDTLSLARRCAAVETAKNALFYYAVAD